MEPSHMDFLSIVSINILGIVAIGISFSSLVVVILFNRKRTKSDQFRVALDLNYRIEDVDNKLSGLIEKYNTTTKSEKNKIEFQNSRKILSLEKLNTLEFFALLINEGEITVESIIRHFKDTFIDDTNGIFMKYPEWKSNEKMFEELKKLLKRFEE
ncbi:MAG: hypothetical protein AB7U98_07890 [Candidatus Nitrosocosmicus sp.]